jgi:hypothetical protein
MKTDNNILPAFKEATEGCDELRGLNAFCQTTQDIISSDNVVYASHEEEFFYKDTDEAVAFGDAVGVEVHIPAFNYLDHEDENNLELEKNPNHRDALKFRSSCSEERESYLQGHFNTKEIKLVLFKNIYHKLNHEEGE